MSSWFPEPENPATDRADLPSRPRGGQRRGRDEPRTGEESQFREGYSGAGDPRSGAVEQPGYPTQVGHPLEGHGHPLEGHGHPLEGHGPGEYGPATYRSDPEPPSEFRPGGRRAAERDVGAVRPPTTSSGRPLDPALDPGTDPLQPVGGAEVPVAADPAGEPEWWSAAAAADPDPAPERVRQTTSRSRGSATLAGAGSSAGSLPKLLAVLAWPALGVGLVLSGTQGTSMLRHVPAWSLFAIACLVLVGIAALTGPDRGPARSWQLGATGAAGLSAFWVLLVLPGIDSNAGFALSLATAAACGAVWLSPGRPW